MSCFCYLDGCQQELCKLSEVFRRVLIKCCVFKALRVFTGFAANYRTFVKALKTLDITVFRICGRSSQTVVKGSIQCVNRGDMFKIAVSLALPTSHGAKIWPLERRGVLWEPYSQKHAVQTVDTSLYNCNAIDGFPNEKNAIQRSDCILKRRTSK